MAGIGGKIAKGAAWMLLFKFLQRSLGLISTIILARLLMPSDFGLVAMAMTVIAMLDLMNSFNFDVAIIQNQQAERHHYDTAWTFEVLFGITSAIFLLVLAAPGANFYNEPRLEMVMYCLALGIFLRSFQNIGIVDFRKNMEFSKEFRFMLLRKLAGFVVTIPLAFIFRSYWALVAGMLSGQLFGVLMSYWVHPYRPRFSLVARAELFHFSKWLFFNNLLFFLRIKSAELVIGKMVGSHALGIYSVANEIASMPTSELIAPINRAVFPGYAKMMGDMEEFRQGFINVISMIILFALPAGAGLAATAELIIPVFLGAKWLDAIPIMQILAIAGTLTALQTNTGFVFVALGKPRILTFLSSAIVVVLIPALIWFSSEAGVMGVAFAYALSAVLFLPVYYALVLRELKLGVGKVLVHIWRPLFATIVMVVAVRLIVNMPLPFEEFLTHLIKLLISFIVGLVVYTGIDLLLWRLSSKPHGAERLILDKVLPVIYRRLPKILRN